MKKMIEMKCVCGYKFKVNGVTYEVPIIGDSIYQLLCEKCYEFHKKAERSL